MSNTSTTKPNAERGRDILLKLVKDGPATLNQLGVSHFRMGALVEDGAVKIVDTAKKVDDEGKPQRGRPAAVFGPTKKGRDRARRWLKAAEAQETEQTTEAA